MNFLAPLFLAGAAAVTLPILFHLLRRSSREKIPFSSLMFLKPSPPKITRRSRLEHIFLLLIRCLVLLLLALGFARPFFPKKGDVTSASSEIKQFVLLVDTSASMRRNGLWDLARARVERILKSVGPSDHVAILTFNRQTEIILNFEQWTGGNISDRVALALDRLQQAPLSWAGTHLGPALTAAAELLESSGQDTEFASKQIVLISDLQEGSHFGGLQGYEWPRDVVLVVESLKADGPTNAGLQLIADSDVLLPNAQPGQRVRVSNSADAAREQFQVSWAAASPEKSQLELYVPPGQSRTVTIPPDGGSHEFHQVRLLGDDQDFDNVLFHVPSKPERVRILYVGSETEAEATQPLYYLKRAFQGTHRQSIEIVSHPSGAPLAAAAFGGMSLAIVTDRPGDESIASLKQFVESGGTVLLVVKTPAVAEVLYRLAGTAPAVASEVGGKRYSMLAEIRFDHPLFAPFADPRYSDFTKIHFWKYRQVPTEPLPDATVVARFDSGDPALIQVSRQKGNLLVLTSSWHPADSQLALSSKFVPLLYSILEQTGTIKHQKYACTVGEAIVAPAALADQAPLRVRKPDGTDAAWPAAASFTDTDLPGIYSVFHGTSTQFFAVNLDAAESKTAPLPIEELERIGLPFHQQESLSKPQIEQNRRELLAVELEKQQQLWRWLLVGVLVVLFAETWLSGRLSRPAAA